MYNIGPAADHDSILLHTGCYRLLWLVFWAAALICLHVCKDNIQGCTDSDLPDEGKVLVKCC